VIEVEDFPGGRFVFFILSRTEWLGPSALDLTLAPLAQGAMGLNRHLEGRRGEISTPGKEGQLGDGPRRIRQEALYLLLSASETPGLRK